MTNRLHFIKSRATLFDFQMSDHDESDNASVASQSRSATSTTNARDPERHSESSFNVGREETKAVKRSKILVFVFIAFAAVASGAATYMFTRNSEVDNFETEVSIEKEMWCYPLGYRCSPNCSNLATSVSKLCH